MATDDNDFQIQIGKNILCYYGVLIYKAKCTNLCRAANGKPLYYVHYIGWKKRYDEWVDYDRILEINSENLAKMAESKRLFSNVKKRKTKQRIKKLRKNSGHKGKTSKILSVESNPIITAAISSEPNKISQQKKRGRPPKSKNGLTTSKTKPIDDPNFDNNKKLMDNLNETNSVDKNRKSGTKQLVKEEKQTCIKDESNLQVVTRTVSKKQDPVINDYIDLTKDEEEKIENNQLVFNIYINRGSSKQPVVHLHGVN